MVGEDLEGGGQDVTQEEGEGLAAQRPVGVPGRRRGYRADAAVLGGEEAATGGQLRVRPLQRRPGTHAWGGRTKITPVLGAKAADGWWVQDRWVETGGGPARSPRASS